MDNFKLFHVIARDPIEYARTWKKEHNVNIIGHFCSYTPEEIILAAGALPFRIFGSGTAVSKADEHLQSYSCSFVCSALADGLSGKLDFLAGTVVPHTCDSIQRLSDIWRMNCNSGFHTDVVLPVKVKTISSREYLVNVLKKFRFDLEKNLGKAITDDDLTLAVKKYNRIRSNIKQIYNVRRDNPELISSSDLHALIKSSMVMDRDLLLEKLPAVITMIENKRTRRPSRLKRLILAGGMCQVTETYKIIEDAGAVIVWDDSCTGSKYFEGEIQLNDDIIESIAGRFSEKTLCPAKHASLFERGEYIAKIARDYSADGVLFLLLKFCDPHAFDYPYIKKLLERQGIPCMLFEVETPLPSGGQLKTRIEAFVEML